MQPQGKNSAGAFTGQVGILGGGQLGCMLADAALGLGLNPILFAEADSPAVALFPTRARIGRVSESDALRAFLTEAPVIVFENEFVDCDALERAASGLAA